MTGSLPLDYSTLLSDATLQHSSLNMAEEITSHPERTLNSIALALHTVSSHDQSLKYYSQPSAHQVVSAAISSEENTDTARDEGSKVELPRLYIRLFNYEPILSLKHLKASQYGMMS